MSSLASHEGRAGFSWQRAPGERPFVLGHRGARLVAPENTLPAFEQALAAGADGVELDVRLNADGHVVVFHDADLTRMTQGNISSRIADLSLAELLEVDLGQGARIPTLEQVLSFAEPRRCRLNIELKSDGSSPAKLVDAVSRLLDANPSDMKALLSSFELEAVRRLAAHAHSVAWLVSTPQELERAPSLLAELGVQAVNPHHYLLSAPALRPLRKQPLLVHTWTVNQPALAIQLAALGVDSIITDDPKSIVRSLSAG